MSRLPSAPWLALAGVFSALVVVAAVWVQTDQRPPEWDHANHLERAVLCHQILSERGRAGVAEIVEMSSFYPPVVPCAAGLLYFVFPITPLTAQAVMLAFLGLALVALFLLGRRLSDARTGLLAAVLFGAAPFVVFSTTNFQLDLPLAAMVAVALLALVRTEGFSRRGWSVATGVILGLGMLTKPPFAVYVLPPLLVSAWTRGRGGERGRRLANVAISGVLGLVIALPWYGPRIFGLPAQILTRSFKQAAEAGTPEVFTSASLFFYPRMLVPQFGLLAALFFLWGLYAVGRERVSRGLLWSASLVPFGLFLLIQNRNLRYTLPLLPAAALIAAVGMSSLPRAWRRLAGAAVLVLAGLQVGSAAFGLPPVPRWRPFAIPPVFSNPPQPAAWPHDEILARMVKESGGRPATVSVVPNYNHFSVSNFRYYAVRDRLSLTLTRAWDQYPLGVDFIILKTGDLGPDFTIAKAKRITERLASGDAAFERVFPVIWEGPLPDGSVGSLRQRRLTPVTGVSPAVLTRRVREAVPRFLEPYAREVEGLTVDLTGSPEGLLSGEIRRARLEARSAQVAEFAKKGARLRVRELRLTLEGVLINPHRLMVSGEIELLGIERLRVDRLVVTEEDLKAFLAGLRRVRGVRLRLEEGAVAVALAQPGPDVAGRLRLLTGRGNAPLAVDPERMSLGGIPVPGFLLRWVFRHYDPAPRLAKLPVAVELGEIRVEPGRIVISGIP